MKSVKKNKKTKNYSFCNFSDNLAGLFFKSTIFSYMFSFQILIIALVPRSNSLHPNRLEKIDEIVGVLDIII